MINSIIYKISHLDRVVFKVAVIERNDDFTIFMDMGVEMFKTYKSLFVTILNDKFKMNYINKNSLKNTGEPKIHEYKLNSKNIFKNIEQYAKKMTNDDFIIESKSYLLSPDEMSHDSNQSFFENFGTLKNKLLKFNLNEFNLNKSCQEIVTNTTLKSQLINIIHKDFCKIDYEIETTNKVDFNYLSVNDLKLLTAAMHQLKSFTANQESLQKSANDTSYDRTTYRVANKCIKATVIIPKNKSLKEKVTQIHKEMSRIVNNNIQIDNKDEYGIAKIINNVFNNKDVKYMKLTYQDEISIDKKKVDNTLEFNLESDKFEKENLKNAIKEYSKIKDLIIESTFKIKTMDDLDNDSNDYIIVDTKTNIKYRYSFSDNKKLKAQLFKFVIGKKEFKAKIEIKQSNLKTKEILKFTL